MSLTERLREKAAADRLAEKEKMQKVLAEYGISVYASGSVEMESVIKQIEDYMFAHSGIRCIEISDGQFPDKVYLAYWPHRSETSWQGYHAFASVCTELIAKEFKQRHFDIAVYHVAAKLAIQWTDKY